MALLLIQLEIIDQDDDERDYLVFFVKEDYSLYDVVF